MTLPQELSVPMMRPIYDACTCFYDFFRWSWGRFPNPSGQDPIGYLDKAKLPVAFSGTEQQLNIVVDKILWELGSHAGSPNQIAGIDFVQVELHREDEEGNRYRVTRNVLTCVDLATDFCQQVIVQLGPDSLAKAFDRAWGRPYGIPKTIYMDPDCCLSMTWCVCLSSSHLPRLNSEIVRLTSSEA